MDFICRQEIKQIRATSYIRGVLTSFIMFTTRICLFFSILAFVLENNVISAKQVFVVTSFYNLLRQTMTVFFPQGKSLFKYNMTNCPKLRQASVQR